MPDESENCLNCGHDLAGLDNGAESNCPECSWPRDRMPSLLRPMGTILVAVIALICGAVLFAYNSVVANVANYYALGSYPSWQLSFWSLGAMALWSLAIGLSIMAPLRSPRLRQRPEARNTTIGLGIVMSFLLPLVIVVGLSVIAN